MGPESAKRGLVVTQERGFVPGGRYANELAIRRTQEESALNIPALAEHVEVNTQRFRNGKNGWFGLKKITHRSLAAERAELAKRREQLESKMDSIEAENYFIDLAELIDPGIQAISPTNSRKAAPFTDFLEGRSKNLADQDRDTAEMPPNIAAFIEKYPKCIIQRLLPFLLYEGHRIMAENHDSFSKAGPSLRYFRQNLRSHLKGGGLDKTSENASAAPREISTEQWQNFIPAVKGLFLDLMLQFNRFSNGTLQLKKVVHDESFSPQELANEFERFLILVGKRLPKDKIHELR